MRAYYSTHLDKQEEALSPDPLVQLIADLGTAAQVFLFILYLDPQPVGEKTISQALNITPGTARARLRKLLQLNLVARSGRYGGYRSIWRGAQLILPLDDQKLIQAKDKNHPSSDKYLLPDTGSEIHGSVENSPSRAKNHRSRVKYKRSHEGDLPEKDKEVVPNVEIYPSNANNHLSIVKNHRSPLTTTELIKSNKEQKILSTVVVRNDPHKVILETLYKYHIGRKKSYEIANMAYMTVRLIEETAKKLKSQGKFSIPLLIHCLQDDPHLGPEETERSDGSEYISNDDPDLEETNVNDADIETEEEETSMINHPAWEQLIAAISANRQLTHNFKNQLDHCTNLIITEERVTIGVDDHISYQWLLSNAKAIIANAFIGIIGRRKIIFEDHSASI